MTTEENTATEDSMGDSGDRVFLRPRRILIKVFSVAAILGLLPLAIAIRKSGVARFLAWAGVLLLWLVLPIGFLAGSRVRRLSVSSEGIHLRGLLLDRVLSWPEIKAVEFLKLGPTTFLVAQTSTNERMPALSPFRRRFARHLEVGDSSSLLVVRTVDFPGGYTAISESIRACAPASLPIGTERSL